MTKTMQRFSFGKVVKKMNELTFDDSMALIEKHNGLVQNALRKNNNDVNALFSDPGLKGALHPALRPNNVHPALKQLFQIPAKAPVSVLTVKCSAIQSTYSLSKPPAIQPWEYIKQ